MDEFGRLTCGCGEEYVETVLVQGWESVGSGQNVGRGLCH